MQTMYLPLLTTSWLSRKVSSVAVFGKLSNMAVAVSNRSVTGLALGILFTTEVFVVL